MWNQATRALIVLLAVVAVACSGDDGDTTTAAVSTTSTSGARPPQEIRVLVLNGSDVDQAAAMKATVLRGLGYAVIGTGDAPTQQGTVVACRPGYEADTVELAAILGSATTIVEYPEPVPAGAEQADCIVGLGA